MACVAGDDVAAAMAAPPILWRCVALGYVASHFVKLLLFAFHHNRIHCLPKMEMKNSDAIAVLH